MPSLFPSFSPSRIMGKTMPSMGGGMKMPGGGGMGGLGGMKMPGPRMSLMPRMSMGRMGGAGGGLRMPSGGGMSLNPMAGFGGGSSGGLGGGPQLAPGVPAKTPNAMLPTIESGLEKVLNNIGRPIFGINAGLNEVLDQTQKGQGLDLGKVGSAMKEGASLNPDYMHSGADILTKAGILPENPQSFLGKATKAFLGSAMDVYVGGAPLNLLHLGNLTEEGVAASKEGQGILPGTVGDQMKGGLRNLASFGPIKSTAIDGLAGSGLNYVGHVVDALASPVKNLFTTGKVGPHLQPYAAKLEHLQNEAIKPYNPDIAQYEQHAALMKNVVADAKAGKVQIDPMRAKIASDLGATTPEAQVKHAIFRDLSQRTLPSKLTKTYPEMENGEILKDSKGAPITRQVDQISYMERHSKIRQAVADGLDYIKGQKEKQPDTNPGWYDRNTARALVAGPGEFMSNELHHNYVSDTTIDPRDKQLINRVTNSIRKQPPEIIQRSIDNLRHGAQVWQEKANLLKFDRDNPETFDPRIKALADYIKPTYDEKITAQRKSLGATILPGEEFEGNRSLTPGAKQSRDTAGYGPSNPPGNPKVFGVGGVTDAHRTFGDFTADQVNRMALNPTLREGVLYKFGQGDILAPRTKVQALMGKPQNHTTIFDTDPMRELGLRMVATKEAVNSAKVVKEIANNFGYDTPEQYTADGKPGKPVEVTIPEHAQLIAGRKTTWMDPVIANEFKTLNEKLISPRSMNDFLKMTDNFSYIWRRLTLFGGPMIAFATANRNLVGHLFLSYLKDGISGKGIGAMAKMMKTFVQRDSILAKEGPEGWARAKAALPTVHGVNLGQAMTDLEQSGQFHSQSQMAELPSRADALMSGARKFLQKGPITGWGQNLDNVSSFAVRAQHYLTRLYQGFEGGFDGAAMRDTKRSLIDYSSSAKSAAEREVFSRLSGFYSWTRFNIPLMFQAMLNHPGKISNVNMIMRNITDSFGQPAPGESKPNEQFLDSFINGNLHMRLFKDGQGNWNYFVLRNWLPLADMEDLTSPGGAGNMAVNMLNPLIKQPLEQFFNKSTFFKDSQGNPQDIQTMPGQKQSMLGLNMPVRLAEAIQELVRPANVLNQYNPGGIFGQNGQVNALGAFRGQAPMGGGEMLGAMLGLRPRAADVGREEANAGFQFRQAFDTYKNALQRATSRGDVPNEQAAIGDLQNLMSIGVPGMAMPKFGRKR
jgi:hypothetical protein